jgi:L-alanine-DL-glutamate epimerase-like enolase superfamily enzyme
MATATRARDCRIEAVRVHCCKIPTATDEESDGTLTWDSTTIVVVELQAEEQSGFGYTYADPSVRTLIEGKLASVIKEADPLAPQQTWSQMQCQLRNLGDVGIGAMAMSAIDVALWDLKAKLLGVCLADALPRYHDSVAIYGSGGFTNLTDEQLREQVRQWTGWGCRSVKIKVGRNKLCDPARVDVVRAEAGPDVELMVDGNGAYAPADAVLWAECFRDQGVDYFEEPVSSDDLHGLALVRQRAPRGIAIAAGEYGWNLPYFQHMLDAGAVDILQADVTRCGGITNMLRIDGLCKARNLPFSAHCAPAISAHACCAMETVKHIEYFVDHYRIESILFEGTVDPDGGRLTPDRERLGLGLELRRDAAERYAV